MGRKWISGLLAIVLCMALTPAALGAGTTFSDVPATHWAYAEIERAAEEGWITGTGQGRYAPAGGVTGAQWLTMLVRGFYPGQISSQVEGAWYQPYVAAADRIGLRKGAGLDSTAQLTAEMTRYQMAAVLDNLLTDAGVAASAAFKGEEHLSDWAQIPVQFQAGVARAYGLGLLTGVDEAGTFAGETGMTRAQAAAVLCRLADLVPVQSPGEDPAVQAGKVSDQVLISQANGAILEQYQFLYGLRLGAVFQQNWNSPVNLPGADGHSRPWFRVEDPRVSVLADIQTVWETYFARSYPIPQAYLTQYQDIDGHLYTGNQGIGDDMTLDSIRMDRVLSRSGTKVVLRGVEYRVDPGSGAKSSRELRYIMVWEDGQWKCGGITWADGTQY